MAPSIHDGPVAPSKTQIVKPPSGLEEECEAMKGNSSDAILHQIQWSVAANIYVFGSQEVSAKVTGEHNYNQKTGDSEV